MEQRKSYFLAILLLSVVGIGLFALKAVNFQKASLVKAPVTEQETPPATVITIEGADYFFKPNEIRVKKDQKVKIVFKNTKGFHDLVVDEFGAWTPQILEGNSTEVTFTPDKVGVFEFYCSVGGHRALGMKGKLIVE